MKQTMGEILGAITYYLGLPEDISNAAKDEILMEKSATSNKQESPI